MPRTKLRQDPDFHVYNSDVVDIDESEDLGWKDGVNKSISRVTSVDVMADHHLHDDLSINFGTCKRQYEANEEVSLVSMEEDMVNKGRRRSKSSRQIMKSFQEIFGHAYDEGDNE